MRRSVTVAVVLLALAAPLAAGSMPASIARLEDPGGHLATFHAEIENALGVLRGVLAAPPTADTFKKNPWQWNEPVAGQEERFDLLRENVLKAYNDAHPKRTYKQLKGVPGGYSTAIDDWQRRWHWLAEAGVQAYVRIKWLQINTKNNKDVNIPLGKRNWIWFQQATGILESALYAANEEIKRRDVAAFQRRIKIAEDSGRVIGLAKSVFIKNENDTKRFFRETKPEKKGKFLDWFKGVEDEKDTWPALYKMKKDMLTVLVPLFGNYVKSYQEMVKIWQPVLDQKFLTAGREFTKGFKMRSLKKNYKDAIADLERKMTAALKR